MTESTTSTENNSASQIGHEPVDWRLFVTTFLIVCGWTVAAVMLIFADTSSLTWPPPAGLKDPDLFPGLSPAIKVCYLFHSKISPTIIAVAIGLCLGISYIFGTFLYKKFRETSSGERQVFWEAVSKKLAISKKPELRELMGAFREYENVILDKRNLYWSLFTRVTLAILVVGLIALLIATCKIESQAGLPIISGIIAFIIGQSAELTHSAGSPPIYVSPGPAALRTDGDSAETDEAKRSSSGTTGKEAQ